MVEVPESSGAYFKADEFPLGKQIEARIIGEGELRDQSFKGQTYKQVVIPVRYTGVDGFEHDVKFSLNYTNTSAITKVLGKQTSAWFNHNLTVLVVPNEQAQSKKSLSVIGVR